MNSVTRFKMVETSVKVFVIAQGVFLTLHCGLCCFGIDKGVAEVMSFTGAFLLLSGAAYMYRLCPLSWAFIVYAYCVRLEMFAEKMGWFGGYSEIASSLCFVVGAFLCSYFLFNIKRFV